VQTRLANRSDAEAIRTIYNDAVLTTTASLDLRARTVDEQLSWIDEHSGVYPAVVATTDDGAIAGFGSLSPYRQRFGYLTTVEDSVYIHEQFRGQGAGRLLLDDLIGRGTAHGFTSIMAFIGSTNDTSIRLHEACGFTTVGTQHKVGRKFGHWLDVVILQRMIEANTGTGPAT